MVHRGGQPARAVCLYRLAAATDKWAIETNPGMSRLRRRAVEGLSLVATLARALRRVA